MNELNSTSLKEFVEQQLADTDCFLVTAEIRQNGNIVVEIDSDSFVDIDFVSALNRKIEQHFSPQIDDFNLEVGSSGLTSPLLLPRQFKKNIGNEMEVLASDGKKYHGVLKSADDNGFVIEVMEKVKKEGEKRPTLTPVDKPFLYTEAKKVTYDLKF